MDTPDPAAAAGFQWKTWTTIAKRRASVYTYRVKRDNSHHTLGYRMATGELRTTIVGLGALDLDGKNPLFWGNLADACAQIPGDAAEAREAWLRAERIWPVGRSCWRRVRARV
jgi:hypothetical protein